MSALFAAQQLSLAPILHLSCASATCRFFSHTSLAEKNSTTILNTKMKLKIFGFFGKKQNTVNGSIAVKPEHRLLEPVEELPSHNLECRSPHIPGPHEHCPEHPPGNSYDHSTEHAREHPAEQVSYLTPKLQIQHTTSAQKDRNIKKLTISIDQPSCVHTSNLLMTLPLELRELVYRELLVEKPLLFPSNPARTFREYEFDMKLPSTRQGREVAGPRPHRQLLHPAYRRTPILVWRNVRLHTGSLIGLLLTNREISTDFLHYASHFELFGFDINSSNCFKPGFWDISTLVLSNIRGCQLTIRCEGIRQTELESSDTPESPSSRLETVLNFVKGTLVQMPCLTEMSFHFVDYPTISRFIQEPRKAGGSSDPLSLANDMAKFLMQLPNMRSIDLFMRCRTECLPFPCATVVPLTLWQWRKVKGQWEVAAVTKKPMRFLGSS